MAFNSVKLRNVHWMFIGIILVSATLLSAANMRTAKAADTATVFVEPSQVIFTTATIGQSFKVNVTLANVTSLAGVEFTMSWNPALLSCFALTENLFHTVTPPAEYDNIWNLKLTKNNTAGTLLYAQTFQDIPRAKDGGYCPINITTANYPEGKIAVAVITFNITQIPVANMYSACNLTLSPVKLGDNSPISQPIPKTVTNGYYVIYGPPETISNTVTYAGTNYTVTTVSNVSVVSGSMKFNKFNESAYQLDFNLTGADGSKGYVNVTIPKNLMSKNPSDQWKVYVNGQATTPIVSESTANWYLYITASLSTKNVAIIGTIPEFTMLFIPLLMAATLIAIVLCRRKQP